MKLAELIAHLDVTQVTGPVDRPVERVVHDSREAGPRDVFVAVRGTRHDARRFVPGLEVAAVIADGPVQASPGVTVVTVPDARRALAWAAAALARFPSRDLPVVGITGTNGKTTTTWLIEAVARANGWTAGVIGTTGHRVAGREVDLGDAGHHTTPEAPVLQELLGRMRDAGCGLVAMEVSSIGLALHRADGIEFRVAVFTGLSRDHLDFHGTMEDYLAAKGRLFSELLVEDGVAVLPASDPAAARIAPADRTMVRYGIGVEADIQATEPIFDLEGCRARVVAPQGEGALRIPLLGAHNLANALAALGAGLVLGIPFETCLGGLEAVERVPGRLEPVPNDRGIGVLVDYAHTPDALAQALLALRPLTEGRLITVFGCGGDRDPGKRPLMGRTASQLSDRVFLTSDNPRSENPMAIIRDILPGVVGTYVIEPDRARAIGRAIAEANRGDVVLIAGKGHETTQEENGEFRPFDDRAVAAAALGARERA